MPCVVGNVKIDTHTHQSKWRHSGLVVSVLDFQSEGWWFEPSLYYCVVSLDKKLYSTLSLFTQVYIWVQAIICWEEGGGGGDNLSMD